MESPSESQAVGSLTTLQAVEAALADASRSQNVELMQQVLRSPVLASADGAAALVPHLTPLCDCTQETRKLSFVNASWKALLTALSHPEVGEAAYRGGMQFMLDQLHWASFSHDWTNSKSVRLAAFVASHAVSAAKAHPLLLLPASFPSFLPQLLTLGRAVGLALSSSELDDTALLPLHDTIVPRVGGVWEAVGAAAAATSRECGEEGEEEPAAVQLESTLLQCVLPVEEEEEGQEGIAAASAAVASLDAFLHVLEGAVPVLAASTVPLKGARAAQRVFELLLRWLPCGAVLTDSDDEVTQRVANCARHVPPSLLLLVPPAAFDEGSSESQQQQQNAAEEMLAAERWVACASGALRLAAATSAAAAAAASSTSSSGGSAVPGNGSADDVLHECLVALVACLAAPDETGRAVLLRVAVEALVDGTMPPEDALPLLRLLLLLGTGAVRGLTTAPVQERRDALLLRWAASFATLAAAVCAAYRVSPYDLQCGDGEASSASAFADVVAACMAAEADAPPPPAGVPPAVNDDDDLRDEILSQLRTVDAFAKQQRQSTVQLLDRHARGTAVRALLILPLLLRQYRENAAQSSELLTQLLQQAAPLLSSLTLLLQGWVETAAAPPGARQIARIAAASLLRELALYPLACDSRESQIVSACVRKWCAMGLRGDDDAEGEGGDEDGGDDSDEVALYASQCLLFFAQHNTDIPIQELRLPQRATAALALMLASDGEEVAAAADLRSLTSAAMKAFCSFIESEEFPPLDAQSGAESDSQGDEDEGGISGRSSCSASTPRAALEELAHCEGILSSLFQDISNSRQPAPWTEGTKAELAARLRRVSDVSKRALQSLLGEQQ